MKIDIIKESGFCGGVTRALYILNKTIKDNPDKPIYLLGSIVHNMLVNEEYRQKGVKIIDNLDLEKLEDGAIVVISAHGKSDREREKLKRFNVVDTTCPYVQKNKMLIDSNEANNIIFIGKKNHAETRCMCGDNPNIYIVEKESDLDGVDTVSMGIVFNQTTFNINKLSKIHEIIRERAPFFEIKNTMCPTSKSLQEFLSFKDDKYDVCIVVGDRSSSNANSLVEMSPYHPTYFINSAKEIKDIKFRRYENIVIIGSASTPKDELKKVKDAIKEAMIPKES